MPTYISLPPENCFYQSRKNLRKQLVEMLKKEHIATLTSVTGRGKSEEAKAFAYENLKYSNEYEVVIWIDCSNRDASYEQAAKELSLILEDTPPIRAVFSYLEQLSQQKTRPPLSETLPIDLGTTLHAQDSKPSHHGDIASTDDSLHSGNRWLLILDNADEPDTRILPLRRNGDIILTSCNTNLPNLIHVPNFERHESQRLILKCIGESKTSFDRAQQALALANAVSDFPAAVTELSRSIKRTGRSLEIETKTYEQQANLFKPTICLRELQNSLEDKRRFPTGNSLQVLRCLAQLGPFNIPKSLLYRWGKLCSPALSEDAINHAIHFLICSGYIRTSDRLGSPCLLDAPIIHTLRMIFMQEEKLYLQEFKKIIEAMTLQLKDTQNRGLHEERDLCIWHAKLLFQRMLDAAGISSLEAIVSDVGPIVEYIPAEERIIYLNLILELSRYYKRFDQLKEAIRFSAIGIKFIEHTSTDKQLHQMIEEAKRLSGNGGYIICPLTSDDLLPIGLFFKQWLTTLQTDPLKFNCLAPITQTLAIQIHAAVTDPAFLTDLKSKMTLPESLTPELLAEPRIVQAFLEFYIVKSLEESTSKSLFWSIMALIPNDLFILRTLNENDGILPLPKVEDSSKRINLILIDHKPYLVKWTGSPDHALPIYPYHHPYFPLFNPLKKTNDGLRIGFKIQEEASKEFLDTYAALLTYHAISLFKQQDEYNPNALAHLQLAFKELNVALIICFNLLENSFGGIKEKVSSPSSEEASSERSNMLGRILYLKKIMIEITLAKLRLQQKNMHMLEMHLNYDELQDYFNQFPYPENTNKSLNLSFQIMYKEAMEDWIRWPSHFLEKLKFIKNELPNLATKTANRVNPFVQANANATAFFSVINRWPHVFSEHLKDCETLERKIQGKGMNPDLKNSFEELAKDIKKSIQEKMHFCQAAIKSQKKPTEKPYASTIALLETYLDKPEAIKEPHFIKMWLALGRLYIKQYKHGREFEKEEKRGCLKNAQSALKQAKTLYYDSEKRNHASWELYDLYYALTWITGKEEFSTTTIDPCYDAKIIQYLIKIRSIAAQLYDGSSEKYLRQTLKLYNTLLATPGSTYPHSNNLFALPLKLPLINANALLNKLNALLSKDEKNISLFLARAEVSVNIGDYDNAIQDYREFLKVYPDSAPALAGKGFAHYKLGDAPNCQIALCDFAKARQLMPLDPFIQYQQELCQKAANKAQMNLQRSIAASSKLALFIRSLSRHFDIKLRRYLDKAKGKDQRDSKSNLVGKAVKASSNALPTSVSFFGLNLDVNLKEVVSGLVNVAIDAHDKSEQYKNTLLTENISDSILNPDGVFSSIAYDIAIIYEDQIEVIARSSIDRYAKYIASNMVHYLRSNRPSPKAPLREKLINGTNYARHRWFDVHLKVDRDTAQEALRSMPFFKRIYLTGCHSKDLPFGWNGRGITAENAANKAGIRTSDGELYAKSSEVSLFGYRAGTVEEALEKGFTLVSTPYRASKNKENGARKDVSSQSGVHTSLSEMQMVLLSTSSKKLAVRDTFDQFLEVNFGLIKEKVAPGPYGGSCQFMATATQLTKCTPAHLAEILKHCRLMAPVNHEHIREISLELRLITARYLLAHKDDFKHFIGKNSVDDADDEFNQASDIPTYAEKIERGGYGGALSLRALSCILQNDILILHPDIMIPRATTMENRIYRSNTSSKIPYLPATDLAKTLILVYNGRNHYDTIVAHPPSDDPRLAEYISAQMVRSTSVLQKTKISSKGGAKSTEKDGETLFEYPELLSKGGSPKDTPSSPGRAPAIG